MPRKQVLNELPGFVSEGVQRIPVIPVAVRIPRRGTFLNGNRPQPVLPSHSSTGIKVGFPYDTSLMFFWEFYSMNMPFFARISDDFRKRHSVRRPLCSCAKGAAPALALGHLRFGALHRASPCWCLSLGRLLRSAYTTGSGRGENPGWGRRPVLTCQQSVSWSTRALP